jgi:hypothetical protein
MFTADPSNGQWGPGGDGVDTVFAAIKFTADLNAVLETEAIRRPRSETFESLPTNERRWPRDTPRRAAPERHCRA